MEADTPPVALDSVVLSSLHFDEGAPLGTGPRFAQAAEKPASGDGYEAADPAVPAPFGKAGQTWWSITGGPAFWARDTQYWGNVSLSLSHFIADDFEIGAELGAWWFDQDGPNAEGLSIICNLRWHFWHDQKDRWTAYADAGIGILGSTQPVPADGLSFNFLPRAGLGLTRQLGSGPERLIAGARWQHISNARIRGGESNPGRDAVQFYVGVVFPF